MTRSIDGLTAWLSKFISNWDIKSQVAEEWATFCMRPGEDTLEVLVQKMDELGVGGQYLRDNISERWDRFAERPRSMQLIYRYARPGAQGFEFFPPASADKEDKPFRSDEIDMLRDKLTGGEQIMLLTGYPRQDVDEIIVESLRSYFTSQNRRFSYVRARDATGDVVAREFQSEIPDVLALDWHGGMAQDNLLINALQYGLLMDPFKKLIVVMGQDRVASNRQIAERAKPLMNSIANGAHYEIQALGIFPKLMNTMQAARYMFGDDLLPHHYGSIQLAMSHIPLMSPYLGLVRDALKKYSAKAVMDEIIMHASKKLAEAMPSDTNSQVSLVSDIVVTNLSRADRIRQPGPSYEMFAVSNAREAPRNDGGASSDGQTGGGGDVSDSEIGAISAHHSSVIAHASLCSAAMFSTALGSAVMV